jgi:hypothetical protein
MSGPPLRKLGPLFYFFWGVLHPPHPPGGTALAALALDGKEKGKTEGNSEDKFEDKSILAKISLLMSISNSLKQSSNKSRSFLDVVVTSRPLDLPISAKVPSDLLELLRTLTMGLVEHTVCAKNKTYKRKIIPAIRILNYTHASVRSFMHIELSCSHFMH